MWNLANTTIGMPVPADADRYYDEYVVKADQPLTASFTVGGRQQVGELIIDQRIESSGLTFIPQPGGDYEIVPVQEKSVIRFLVRRLHVRDGVVSAETEPFAIASPCE